MSHLGINVYNINEGMRIISNPNQVIIWIVVHHQSNRIVIKHETDWMWILKWKERQRRYNNWI